MDKDIRSKSAHGMQCPRCGGPIVIGQNMAALQFGLIGWIIWAMSKTYSCATRGPIKFRELPPDVRAKVTGSVWLWVVLMVLMVTAGVLVGLWSAGVF